MHDLVLGLQNWSSYFEREFVYLMHHNIGFGIKTRSFPLHILFQYCIKISIFLKLIVGLAYKNRCLAIWSGEICSVKINGISCDLSDDGKLDDTAI